MAFKDVGARFMARCLGYFNTNNNQEITVLVATSGDTGGAVANGFLGVKGVKVVILYPSGKVSRIQEQQLTTLGQNITALEVNGTFDDCQDMVKKAFTDTELITKMKLTKHSRLVSIVLKNLRKSYLRSIKWHVVVNFPIDMCMFSCQNSCSGRGTN